MVNNEHLLSLLHERRYKDEYKPKDEQIILKIDDRIVGTLGNFCVLSGLPKAGKSSFLGAIVASAITRQSIFGIQMMQSKKVKPIAFFDTESSEFDFYKNMDRIKNIGGINKMPSYFEAFRTRDCNHIEIKEMIEYFIQSTSTQIVVIDGLLDLLLNFNDETESRLLINWLKKLTDVHKCFVLGVIHTGKGTGATLGHLGSMVERYAQSTLLISKDDERMTTELSAKYMRSDAHFEPIVLTQHNGNFSQLPFIKQQKK